MSITTPDLIFPFFSLIFYNNNKQRKQANKFIKRVKKIIAEKASTFFIALIVA